MTTLRIDSATASLSHKVFEAQQVRLHEPTAASQSGCDMYTLMERAGTAAFDAMRLHWHHARRILVVVGTGNNGGDGYVLARLAKRSGMDVVLASLNPDKALAGDAATVRAAWEADGGDILPMTTDVPDVDLIIDAMLGTGLSGDVKADIQSVIEAVNDAGIPVFSIDIPSGMHADTGASLGAAIVADATMTFVGIKPGLVTGTGKHFTGHLLFNDLDIGQAFASLATSSATMVEWNDFSPLPDRPMHAHKGNFGRVVCIGGNKGMSGAIRLTSEAMLRCGAGLVKVFCHHESRLQVSAGRPELMVTCDNLAEHLEWADVVVLGPGLGQDGWSRSTFNDVLSYLVHEDKPTIIDADGLNLLADHLHNMKLSQLVITPHPAEAARLLRTETADVEADRYQSAELLGSKFSASAVLKGAGSLVSVDGDIYICANGNPGMATAGMGDVLTGVIGALLAQGLSADDSALMGTVLHSAAGDLCAENHGQRGMLAGDLFDALRLLLNP